MNNLQYFEQLLKEHDLVYQYNMELLSEALSKPEEHMDFIRAVIDEIRLMKLMKYKV